MKELSKDEVDNMETTVKAFVAFYYDHPNITKFRERERQTKAFISTLPNLIFTLRQSQAECERLNGELSKPDAMSGITIAGLTAECERLKGDNKKLAYDVAHLVVGRDETISRLTRDLAEAYEAIRKLWKEKSVNLCYCPICGEQITRRGCLHKPNCIVLKAQKEAI